MMKKYLFISFIITLIFNSNAFAKCDFELIDLGKSKENLKQKLKYPKDQPLMLMPDNFGGETFLLPLDESCKDQESLHGTMGEYLFINDKLERIMLTRANMSDRNLMIFAMKKYGKFALPEGLPLDQWRGNHFWETGNTLIEYLVTNIPDEGFIEAISIQRLKNTTAMNKYYEKVGKWLDSEN